MCLSEEKINLMKKIINAKLSKEELNALTMKATEMINRRTCAEKQGESKK